jgi:hypothetical protein
MERDPVKIRLRYEKDDSYKRLDQNSYKMKEGIY